MNALITIDPSKVKTLADKIDLDGASDELLALFMPVVVKNKIASQMEYIAPLTAFYPFVKFQDPELGKTAEEGYNWIMSSDHLKAVEKITKTLGYAKNQMENNPQAKMMVVQTLKDGLSKKMELLRQNPQNAASINKQIDAINKAIENFK